MIHLLKILFLGILVSMFYFPVEFLVLPGINTKMMLAVVGLIFTFGYLIRERSMSVPRELLYLIALASAVSLVSLLSVTVNQTPDYSYVTYIVSFSVWLSAAFAICVLINFFHGHINVKLVLNYLVGVSFFQCVSAIAIDQYPGIANWVDSYFSVGQEFAREIERLYGLGAFLDTAGLRFSAVLVGQAFYLSELKNPLGYWGRVVHILMFFSITVMGSMIARTTLVGAGIGLSFIIIVFFIRANNFFSKKRLSSFFTWVRLITATVLVSVVLYNTDNTARKFYRFAFEGFFSLAEKGVWETSSSNLLIETLSMPKTLHTWVIGDGYFENSRNDENYLGDATIYGYYMGTDMGYLRFIYYFGVTGLLFMMGVIICATVICARHFKNETWLFVLVLMVGLVVWMKVATDIFCFFALFLSAAALKEYKRDENSLYHSRNLSAGGDGTDSDR